MGLIPDEAKVLPPPGIVNRNSVWMGIMGWSAAMLDNAMMFKPPLKAGVHRQVLFATVGWFIGYHVSRYADYAYAKRDREMFWYMKLHPEKFPEKKKRLFGEITEPFVPIR